ncbi:MAG: ATP-binding protein, partial [Coprothermobacterota bacterium]|nr:ATP-binding protein [Coprothermobacterota bacterium]
QVVREAIVNNQHPLDFLAACLSLEADGRMQRLLQKRIKQARFPAAKTLDNYDFSLVPDLSRPRMLDLAEGGFIQEKENVVILGPSGLGKTHLAIGIGMGAILAGCQVRFTTAAALAQELRLAHKELRLPKLLKSYSRQELVIVDELGWTCCRRLSSGRGRFLALPVLRGTV